MDLRVKKEKFGFKFRIIVKFTLSRDFQIKSFFITVEKLN